MTHLLELVIMFNGFGNLLVSYKLLNTVNKLDLVIMAYGVVFVFMPWEKIVNVVFNLHGEDNETHYLSVY